MDKKQKSSISVRPPIITVLGHVDHGKTTLLDKIRQTDIAVNEHGGITQKIGAYQIDIPQEIVKKQKSAITKITFIDTPGHEASAKMRARGANAADIAILVIAANDGIQPQTIESIEHIKNAKIPCIIALNKIDLPGINIDKVKKQLAKNGLNPEEYGGDTPIIEISAKTGKGIDKILETILLLSDLYQISNDTSKNTQGVVIESTISKNRGITATVALKNGQISISNELVCDNDQFKIRSINNWRGLSISQIDAGDAAEITGWKKIPEVGSLIFKKGESDKTKQSEKKGNEIPVQPAINTNQNDEDQKIKIILKTDTLGSLEAITSGLEKNAQIILKNSGMISESDVLLAKTTKSIIIGFNLVPSSSVLKLAQSEKVIIKTYKIIYELFDEITDVIEALKKGDLVEILGTAKIIAQFEIKGVQIAGIKVASGRIAKGDQIKIMRGETEIGRTRIKSVRHHKDEITKAETGMEVGIALSQKLEYLTGDSIISIG